MHCDKENAFTNGIYFLTISTSIIETKSISEKNSGNSRMVHFPEISKAPLPCSIL